MEIRDDDLIECKHYTVSWIIEPNVIEIDKTWFVKLEGVPDDSPEELGKWLEEGFIVRVIPRKRMRDARILSDVWLGNIHINRQISTHRQHKNNRKKGGR